MAIVLTRKGIITTLVLLLVLIAVGVGGYIAWTTINAENLGNEDSSAGESCSGRERADCNGCGGVKDDGKSYECQWYSANGGQCRESARECDAGDNGGSCSPGQVGGKVDGQGGCALGSTACQEDHFGKRNGYNCTCIDVSSGAECLTNWQCTSYDTAACPPETEQPPGNFQCAEIVNGCAVFGAGTSSFNAYFCPGTGDDDMSGGCQDNGETINGRTFCPSSAPAGFCGWIQVDSIQEACFASWNIPCDEPEDEEDNPGVCFEACGTGCPTGLSCQNNICVNPSCPTAADCQCNSAWTITKSAAVVCVNENTPQVASQVDYTIAITFNSNGQTGQIGSVLDEFTTSPVTIQNSWFGNISTGGSLATGTTTGGSILWTLTGDNRNFIAGQTRTFTFRMTVPGAPYDAVNQTSPSFGNYTNRVTADVLTPNATQDLVISRTTLVGCDIPATGIFDSTFSKVMLAMVLILVGYIYFASSKVEGMMLGMYQGIENTVGKEALDRKKIMKTRDTFEDRVTKE
jgi:hypothetical protein